MSLFLQLKKFPVLISDVWSLKAYQNIISVKPTMNNKHAKPCGLYHSYTYDKKTHENQWYSVIFMRFFVIRVAMIKATWFGVFYYS